MQIYSNPDPCPTTWRSIFFTETRKNKNYKHLLDYYFERVCKVELAFDYYILAFYKILIVLLCFSTWFPLLKIFLKRKNTTLLFDYKRRNIGKYCRYTRVKIIMKGDIYKSIQSSSSSLTPTNMIVSEERMSRLSRIRTK